MARLKQFEKKLTEEQRLECIRMRAEFHTFQSIADAMLERHGVSITKEGVSQAVEAKKWEPQFKKFREDYLNKIKDVPIANKRIRLDDMERARQKLMRAIDRNAAESKEDLDELRKNVLVLNDLIKRSNEEMERKGIILPGYGLGEFSDKSDDELVARRDELIERAKTILGNRTAGVDISSEGAQAEDISESA